MSTIRTLQTMSLSFLELPPEIQTHVFGYLSSYDLINVALVNKHCQNLVDLDSIWQRRCREDYHFDDLTGWNLTYKELYSEVLYKYGTCRGIWQADIGHYGGLVNIKICAGCINGYECLPPVDPNVDQPMRIRQLFTIKIDGDSKKSEVFCLKGFNGLHKGKVEWHQGEAERLLKFSCSETLNHQHPDGKQKEFEDWLTEETGRPPDEFFVHGQELLLMKFLVTTQLGCSYPLSRLRDMVTSPERLIQEGLFKGNYGGHGIEIIQLTYLDEGSRAEGLKITGDPNVPAGKVSLYVDMSRPMILTGDQQRSVQLLEEIDIPDLPPDLPLRQLPRQSFHVPHDCFERYHTPPNTCRARFHGQGQIAGHGFTNPSMSSGHFVVFDEDRFGFLWLELRSFSMYHRVSVLEP